LSYRSVGDFRQIVKTPKVEICETIRKAHEEGVANSLIRIFLSSAQGAIKPCPVPKGPLRIYNYSESKADFSLFTIPNGEYEGILKFSKDDDDNVGTFISTALYKRMGNKKRKN